MQDALLDSRQVALNLHVSRSYAYLLMRRGDLPAVRMGRLVRVRQSDLDRYITRRSVQRQSPRVPAPLSLARSSGPAISNLKARI